MVVIDGSVPNTLVIANCEVVKQRVAAAEHIGQVLDNLALVPLLYMQFHIGFCIIAAVAPPIIFKGKSLTELLQNSKIVATHTDSLDVLTGHQDNTKFALGMSPTEPFVLTGHQDNAEFALAMCPTEPFVLSGDVPASSSNLFEPMHRKPKSGAISLQLNLDDIFSGRKQSRRDSNPDSISSFVALSSKTVRATGSDPGSFHKVEGLN
ncbi:Histone-binding protein RBBP4 or subunit C of CAF1 complex domain-containing protein [Forsythia ovata]|uniref:Histone-binding protein RBBP4 or subunit C of CAF1 complex domain-containing protein n=1 Tax=Forsythia ovata TaxID=205694 RepID=A0ABD1XAB2_9LAMI